MSRRSIARFGVALVAATLVSGIVSPTRPLVQAATCTAADGQALIDAGRYEAAIREFSCVIESDPTAPDGYRGRAEAELLLGRFANALSNYTRVYAVVLPVHPDAFTTIFAGYGERLASDPDDIVALTGSSFARWAFFQYNQALHQLNHLLELDPDSVYGNLFRGSSRLLRGVQNDRGVADLERAIALASDNPDVRFIVADAYTYGLPDPERAFAEATLAFEGGLETPRVHAMLAAALNTFGDVLAAADHTKAHIDLVTTEFVAGESIEVGETLGLDVVAGRTFELPVAAAAGETISIATSSHAYWDTIAVLLGPDGTPVLGSDDVVKYMAAFDYVAPVAGTYTLQVTFFEGAATGELDVTRR